MAQRKNLDLELVRTFETVVSLKSFSRAAERLNRTQSTVSAQIKRLETELGVGLLARSTRSLHLTDAGELVLARGRELLKLNDELVSKLVEPALEGTVRLGTPEDFASAHLPGVLQEFSEAHPRVRLEVCCELTRTLARQFDQGRHDLVLLKREPLGPSLGTKVWREPLVWVRSPRHMPDLSEIALVVSPEPCVYRERAVVSLSESRRRFRIAYQSTSLAGALAAVQAGLGVTILPRDMVPHGYQVMGDAEGMPDLPDSEIALCMRDNNPDEPVRRLYTHIVHALEAT